MAKPEKNLEISYLLDFYGSVLTERQREIMEQYYNDDLSLSEIGENFGISRQGARDAIKHGESTLLELEEKVGFAARYRTVQANLDRMKDILKKASFENHGAYGRYSSADFDVTIDTLLAIIQSMDEDDA